MSDNEEERKPLFVPNQSGVGYHPRSWQGWLILIAIVVIIVVVVILLRRG